MQINTCGRRLAFFNGAMDASVVVCAPLSHRMMLAAITKHIILQSGFGACCLFVYYVYWRM
jgi:hypothetical protein